MEDNIKRTILKYKKLIPDLIIQRDLEILETKLQKADIIVGPRRAGKTYYLYSLIKKQKGREFILINFEDNLLAGLTGTNLNSVLEYSKELFPDKKLVFFFDELQVIDGWERFIVSLLNENYPVTITGSNSKLLSREIATSLRGKSLPYLLLPLSFSEYLKFKGIKLEKDFEYTDQVYAIKKEFREYLQEGGFPEVTIADSDVLKNKLINSYFDSILYKDLADRLKLKNIKLLEITIKYLLNLFGNIFSISAFENYLKSNKVAYSLEDLYAILRALEYVFMLSYVKEYSKSYKKSEFSKSKVYLFDTGYIHFLSSEAEDYGRILENIVFIELFRREGNIENKNIFYYKSNKNQECDFVILKKGKINIAIQISYELNEKNREREIQGLLSAMDFFGLKEGLILTLDQKEEIRIEDKKIITMPVWKWLLGQRGIRRSS